MMKTDVIMDFKVLTFYRNVLVIRSNLINLSPFTYSV